MRSRLVFAAQALALHRACDSSDRPLLSARHRLRPTLGSSSRRGKEARQFLITPE